MEANDNSVNIAPRPRRYHHGDLRTALVEAGLDLLKSGPAEDLSLREIARRVGVSATAVYRHFPDKAALLYALCQQGAAMLAQSQREAMEAAGGGAAGFDATGRAYVRFALANPALFRLMMASEPPGGQFAPDLTSVNAAMRGLRENIAALLPPDATDEQKRVAAIHAWAFVHGMAMLMLDGQIPATDALIDTITR